MLARELPIPCDPLAAARKAAALPGLCFLHSGLQAYGLGRYSVLAAHPHRRFSYREGAALIEENGRHWREAGPLFERLEAEFAPLAQEPNGPLPFYGGAIGYLAYDAGRYLEKCLAPCQAGPGWDARFAFYAGGIVFDHLEQRTFVTCLSEELDTDLNCLVEAVSSAKPTELEAFALRGALRSNFTRTEFAAAVQRAREHIRDGDVYQVNLSQRFEGPCSGSALDLFERLAEASPAPYAAYLDFGDEQIVSSSPERFFLLSNGLVTTRPIKGTRPAGKDEAEAAAQAKDLAGSEKDRSELLMIVDLERNDLGRVCQPGSVRVEDLFRLERYATVLHQTADVWGALEKGRGLVDCLRAMFPGGSITGAPKIRAMQLIDELERGPRGVYTGSIGRVSAGGSADFNVAIRTIRVANGSLSFQVGGGIVWDSNPESEYEETLLKAKAMRVAIGDSQHG